MACQLDNMDSDHELIPKQERFKVKINLLYLIRMFPTIVIDEDIAYVTRYKSHAIKVSVLKIVSIFKIIKHMSKQVKIIADSYFV